MTDVNEQIPSDSFSFLHAFFFFLELSCVTSFFLFFSCFFFFLFSSSLFGVRLFSFFILRGAEFVLAFVLFSLFLTFFFFSFRCWTFLLVLSGGCRICSSCFWSLFLVSYFLGALCFLSLL